MYLQEEKNAQNKSKMENTPQEQSTRHVKVCFVDIISHFQHALVDLPSALVLGGIPAAMVSVIVFLK